MQPSRPFHLSLILLAGISLLAALWAGLSRLGWEVPLPSWSLPAYHGPLMVVGFIGTLIGLERAVALKRLWAYGAPAFSGLGALALLVGLPWRLGHTLMEAGSLFLISIFALLYRRHRAIFTAVMGLGAVLLFVGYLLWRQGEPLYQSDVIPWWAGFLVLTIAGERLELSRLMGRVPWRQTAFLAAGGIFVLGLALSLLQFQLGFQLAGAGMVALAWWLLRYDIVWLTVRQAGLPRFMAISLIAGYLWLAAAGLLWILFAHLFIPGPEYDAMLHSIFLGFVFSMIIGHAPIILPSVIGISIPFQWAFYGHLCLLHLSLALRVGGELAHWIPAQRWGGLLNVVTVLLFLANHVRAAWLGQTKR